MHHYKHPKRNKQGNNLTSKCKYSMQCIRKEKRKKETKMEKRNKNIQPYTKKHTKSTHEVISPPNLNPTLAKCREKERGKETH